MNILKKHNYILTFLIFIIVIALIQTIANLLFSITPQINKIISLTTLLLYSFIIGYKKGKKTNQKAYKIGFKIGITDIIILYILSCITLTFHITIPKLTYYIILIITTILGSIIGINKKA